MILHGTYDGVLTLHPSGHRVEYLQVHRKIAWGVYHCVQTLFSFDTCKFYYSERSCFYLLLKSWIVNQEEYCVPFHLWAQYHLLVKINSGSKRDCKLLFWYSSSCHYNAARGSISTCEADQFLQQCVGSQSAHDKMPHEWYHVCRYVGEYNSLTIAVFTI